MLPRLARSVPKLSLTGKCHKIKLKIVLVLSVKRCESPSVMNIKLVETEKWTGRAFHKIRGYPDFTIAFDYDDDLFHIFNNDQEIATCDTASEAKRLVKTRK